MSDICHNCHLNTLVKTEETPISSLDPPVIDIQEYKIWRCSTCGAEAWRKPDGSASRDERFTKIFGIGDDRE